jgi:hypothetical protein
MTYHPRQPAKTTLDNLSPKTVFLSVVSICLLGIAWTKLRSWYAEQASTDYILFATCFITALLIQGAKRLRSLWSESSKLRFLLASLVLFLALPWSEWFQLALPNAREDWSRQIFQQCCFLYGTLLFFGLFPHLKTMLQNLILMGLEWPPLGAFLAWIPVVFFCFCALIMIFVYERTPLVQDTAAHLFQAKIFLAGKLTAPRPPAAEVFSSAGDMLVLRDGKWFSSYLPGFPLLLAIASIIHCEWLICPLLGALTAWIWIQYARRYYNRRIAFVLGTLILFSPMLILMDSSIMVHTAELLYSSAIIYLCRRQTEAFSSWRMIAIAAILFLSVITRGFSVLPFLAPILLYALSKIKRPHAIKFGAVTVAAIFCGIMFVGIFQSKTTGSFWVPAYNLETTESQYFGFNGEFLYQKHSPLRGLENTSNSLIAMNSWLTGWPSGTLFFIILFILLEKKVDGWDLSLLLCCASLALFYFFYVFQDLIFGPRFWFLMVPILLLFTVRGIFAASLTNSSALPVAMLSLIVAIIHSYPHYIELYAPQHLQAGQLRKCLAEAGSDKAIIVLDPKVEQNYVNWNDPFLQGNLIIANQFGRNNEGLRHAFPDYKVLYFRETQIRKGLNTEYGYGLMPEPDPLPPGSFSLQKFILLIETANGFSSHDIFDSSYVNLFEGVRASDSLSYLNRISIEVEGHHQRRDSLKSSAIHLARAILLLKANFEKFGDGWQRTFPFDEFQTEIDDAWTDATNAGEVGTGIREQIIRIRKRIGRDRDQRWSDSEVLRFLSRKVRILETQQ